MIELVFIGVDMSQYEIEASLDKCLLTDEEMQLDWNDLKDPLPPFIAAQYS